MESNDPLKRAEIVGARPDVRKWLRAFDRLCASMPPDLQVYVAGGTPTVMVADRSGRSYEAEEGGRDRRAILHTPPKYRGWDGGDW